MSTTQNTDNSKTSKPSKITYSGPTFAEVMTRRGWGTLGFGVRPAIFGGPLPLSEDKDRIFGGVTGAKQEAKKD
jgi:hypothetical protein